MARDEALALPVVVDLVTAGRAWGWSRSRVYEHHSAGELPFPVVTIGGRYKVTREALLTSLGIDPTATSNIPGRESATVPDMDEPSSREELSRVTTDQREAPRRREPESHIRAV
jgi:hypothetical protein